MPGIGEKTAERMAFFILDTDVENVEFFSESLMDVKNKIRKCTICNNFTDQEICPICANKNRNNDVLCIVEDSKKVIMFEKAAVFNGYYHIIDNLISPLDGINPEDIGLEKLLKRIKNENFKEVIIAVRPSIEGETTMQYIKKLLVDIDVKISKIATGVPMGTDMEYIDSLTLEMAIDERKNMN